MMSKPRHNFFYRKIDRFSVTFIVIYGLVFNIQTEVEEKVNSKIICKIDKKYWKIELFLSIKKL